MQQLLVRVVLLLAVFLVAAALTAEAAVSQAYELQRRMGSNGHWKTLTTFTISRHSAQSAPRLKSSSVPNVEFTKEEKNAITAADLISYRAIPEGTASSATQGAAVSVSPCSIIRGFEAVDSSTVVLREKVRVAPGPGTTLIGLQVASDTNFFHSKMLHGDECDLSVVQKLFPTVRVTLELGLVQPVELASKVNYADLKILSGEMEESGKRAPAKRKTAVQRVKNEDGEWEEKEVEVDERSFLQKYWMYLAIPIVMSVVQNMNK